MKKTILFILLSIFSLCVVANATFLPNAPSAFMHEDNNGGVGSAYTLSTSFTTWTSATNSDSTLGLTVDEGAGTITIGAGLDGRYAGTLHASIKAPSGKIITMGIFKNDVKVDDIVRGMAKGAEVLPIYVNITSDDGSAAFGAQSSISYLYYSDGDDLLVTEAGTGSTRCMDVRVGFGATTRPDIVRIGTTAYESNNSNHWLNALMKNYSTGLHVDLNELSKDFEDVGATTEPFERVTWNFGIPDPARLYVENGASELLIQHNDVSCANTHTARIDETKLIDAYSSAVVAFPVEFSVVEGDVITLQLKANEADVDVLLQDYGINIFKIGN